MAKNSFAAEVTLNIRSFPKSYTEHQTDDCANEWPIFHF